jgi:hypothetical protein
MKKHTKVRLVVDNTQQVLRAMTALTSREVLVGIPAGAPARAESGINNATIGYIQDTGSPAANIPARPWLAPGIKDAREAIVKRLKQMGEQVLKNPGTSSATIDSYLSAIGLETVSAVRARITSGPFEPLAASTLRARRARGFAGTRPLIVTGQLRNAVNYVLRDKPKKGAK